MKKLIIILIFLISNLAEAGSAPKGPANFESYSKDNLFKKLKIYYEDALTQNKNLKFTVSRQEEVIENNKKKLKAFEEKIKKLESEVEKCKNSEKEPDKNNADEKETSSPVPQKNEIKNGEKDNSTKKEEEQ
tara:strand:+ start:1440 stop:1835 length:396 start_codon:yes stop_codon:yes gene_type:complete